MEVCNGSKMKRAIAFLVLLNAFALAGSEALFRFGTGNSYLLTSTVILNEPEVSFGRGKDVGYQIKGDVSVGVIWQNSLDKNEKLLEIQLKQPKLLVRSKKDQTSSFEEHKSHLDKAEEHPFLVHWKNGTIHGIYTEKREELSLENFKKGIASLFQFQVTEGETKENDSSGNCLVVYKSIDSSSFSKTKRNCHSSNSVERWKRNSDSVLGGKVTSSRTSTYKLSKDLTALESVTSFENHELIMAIQREFGSSVSATQLLTLIGDTHKVKAIESSSLENAVKEFENSRKLILKKGDLEIEAFLPKCDKEEDCFSLPKLLKENRQHLSDSNLGTSKSAFAFVKLLSAARTSTKADLTKAFKGTKNKEIFNQLCDLAGAVQTKESHEVMMKLINFDSDQDIDRSERYLWALATGSHPEESVLRDIFKISERAHPNEKLDETLVLTVASMAHKFASIPGNENNSLTKEITDSITGELEICKDEYCKIKYLRALRNLKCPETMSILIGHALNGKPKTGVEAMKALKSFEPSRWTEEVLDLAQKIYFQAGKKYDSSSRTLAADILLESNPRREILQELLLSLVHRDPAYEVKQYLVQRVKQISEKDENFSRVVGSIRKEFSRLLNNYNVEAQRGLTTAFARDFASSPHRNGSLETALEISRGLLKRGTVDVVIENSQKRTSLFTLGLFAGGLSSFLSSSGDEEEGEEVDDDDEVTTAGMELTVLGTQIRPFTFFSGQGELMGHVWSGTASEKTPAYQAIILAVDYRDRIPLQNGFLVETEVLGAVSFDLSGQIQISIWNKNAHSLVEKSGGISLVGQTKVDSSFVRSRVEFNVATETQLNLLSDLNFYGGNFLCMQLSQPEIVIKHKISKFERIPGNGKHRLRRSKHSQAKVPGRTYVLNKKNNEMCNLIFNED